MAGERLPMRKLREVIRLRLQAGQSGRAIARSCAISPSTVGEYLGRIALAGLSWPLRPELDDDAVLERLLFPDEHRPVSNRPEPDWGWIHTELQRRHVTKMLLWHEYKEGQPGGLQYSQFCDRYLRWARAAVGDDAPGAPRRREDLHRLQRRRPRRRERLHRRVPEGGALRVAGRAR